jgi:hypothetical protein
LRLIVRTKKSAEIFKETYMSALYVVPLVQTTQFGFVDGSGNPLQINVPKYFDSDLAGQVFAAMPLTGANLALIATAENDALASESDVFSFGPNLDSVMTDDDLAALTTILQNASVPTDFLVQPITYQAAAQMLGAIAQTLQQAAGAGNPIQLGSSGNAQKVGSLGSPASQNAGTELLASAAQFNAPLILDSGNGSAL